MTVSARTEHVTSFVERLRLGDDTRYVYTYPFKGAYRPLASHSIIRDSWLAARGRMNLYVHIPFCNMKCAFCHLLTTTNHDTAVEAAYVSALQKEVSMLRDLIDYDQHVVESLYIGGGTPTAISFPLLRDLVAFLRHTFRFAPDSEFAIETTPDSVDDDTLLRLRACGFSRVSIGVQTFHPDELTALARSYEPHLAPAAIEAALRAGFMNVNVDLIYGLPDQSASRWLENVTTAVSLGVPTITLYPLVFRSHTRLGKARAAGACTFPDAALRSIMYDDAAAYLLTHGYRQYSAVGFTRTSTGCRQEINEFLGVPTLGIGAGALTYGPTFHHANGEYHAMEPPSLTINKYLDSLSLGELPIRTGVVLDADELRRRFVIMRLSHEALHLNDYMATFRTDFADDFAAELTVLRDTHCIVERDDAVALSHVGRRATSLIADLFASELVRRLATSYN